MSKSHRLIAYAPGTAPWPLEHRLSACATAGATACTTISPRATSALRRALLAWYRATARDLPWRRTRDPYRVWLSEIMLQQTRVETVVPYFERFLAAFPTVRELAAARLDRVLKLWEGLGYYSRARNLHAAARAVAGRRAGEFPRTSADWRELPGVGPYTAAAIASIVSDEPIATVDGNIKRVLARLFCIATPLNTPATQAHIWNLVD
jgi:A/G-specific adenine glycosylase